MDSTVDNSPSCGGQLPVIHRTTPVSSARCGSRWTTGRGHTHPLRWPEIGLSTIHSTYYCYPLDSSRLGEKGDVVKFRCEREILADALTTAGRAATNRSGRYEATARERFDDGWEIEEELPPFRTEVSIERPRTAITRNSSPDIHFDRSINPYRGCEHGCIYCFARPTHA